MFGRCELCQKKVDFDQLSGCESCKREFCPACKSTTPDLCLGCGED